MDVLEILAIICTLVGVIGCVVPILPGVPICYVGMLLCYWAGAPFTTSQLVLWAVVAVAVTLLDNFLPAVMTDKFGGSKAATRGSMIGIIVGFFAGPLGLILGPFFGAVIGGIIGLRIHKRALRTADGLLRQIKALKKSE